MQHFVRNTEPQIYERDMENQPSHSGKGVSKKM
jgi:hypothetical protein